MVDADNILELMVPESVVRRTEIVLAARNLIQKQNLKLPVEYTKLQELAQHLIEEIGGTSDELAFALLICGNELWRPFVAATPFNRRLLLMPQCLKNSSSCQAVIDDLGLICAGCNCCPMNKLLAEAEELGYTTLIAEGTTVAVGLVEEGAVDAVIGVSCMQVLQKSFDRLNSVAIPAIAVPLLYDGCSDTKVDEQWLLSEIRAHEDRPNEETLSVNSLKKMVDSLFTEENLIRFIGNGNSLTATEELAVKALLQGGRRMRPLFTLMAYKTYADFFDVNLANRLMLCVECFHKASLIHDDIEDRDEYRYQQKTVHAEHGIAVAINLGDFLIGKGYQLLSELPLNAELKAKLFTLVAHEHIQSTIGQGEELLMDLQNVVPNVSETIAIFDQKTGSAIKVSFLLGAFAAGASETETQLLGRFSLLFGIAYQIRDDLTEFQGVATDQHTASYPILKSLLKESISQIPSDETEMAELIKNLNIEEKATALMEQQITTMKQVLYELNSDKLRFALLNLVNAFFKI